MSYSLVKANIGILAEFYQFRIRSLFFFLARFLNEDTAVVLFLNSCQKPSLSRPKNICTI